MPEYLEFVLLAACWVTALVTLVIFLESGFALARRGWFEPHRASGTYGFVSIFLPMDGPIPLVQRAIQSVFQQSYPFVELILVYPADDPAPAALAAQIRSVRSHVNVRLVPVDFAIRTDYDRVRALDSAQTAARGRWLVLLSGEMSLDRYAIEYAVEFANSNEASAVSLRPGVRCHSLRERVMAPTLEHFANMVRRTSGKDSGGAMRTIEPFLLANREAFSVVNRLNRMPGVLNDAGWNLWSFRLDGLKTIEADGSRWIWRDSRGAWRRALTATLQLRRRARSLLWASIAMTLVTLAGIGHAVVLGFAPFISTSIAGFAGMSYLLMALNYGLYARHVGGAVWLAPFWAFIQLPSCVTALIEIHRAQNTLHASEEVRTELEPDIRL